MNTQEPAYWTYLPILVFISILAMLFIFLPDIDLEIPLLHHRSMVTHSVLIPYLLMRYKKFKIPDVVILALLLGFAIHMSADLTPKSWKGYALIYVPIIKISLFGALGSYLWLAANVVACFYLFKKIMNEEYNAITNKILYIMVFVISLIYVLGGEENIMVIVYALLGMYVCNNEKATSFLKSLFKNE